VIRHREGNESARQILRTLECQQCRVARRRGASGGQGGVTLESEQGELGANFCHLSGCRDSGHLDGFQRYFMLP
jgi:hypothetical protein